MSGLFFRFCFLALAVFARRTIILVLFFQLVTLSLSVFPQGQTPVQINLGAVEDVFALGQEVSLPVILLFDGTGPEIVGVSVQLSFPSDAISLIGISQGFASEAAQARIETDLGTESGDLTNDNHNRTLHIEVTASQSIPEGVLLSLNFKASERVHLASETTVKNLQSLVYTADGQKLQVEGKDGSIRSLTALPACLFYMH